MGALEQNLENFLDNNTPGGYIQTNVSISNNEIEALIDEKINNRGFITNTQETDPTVPAWAKQSVKPTYTAQEVGAMPNNGVSISNTLDAGEGRSRIATITINGTSTDIYGANSNGTSGGITGENDPIFTSWVNEAPAANITYTDILNWNNKSDFDANLLSPVAFTGNYNDLSNSVYNIDFGEFIYQFNENTEIWEEIASSKKRILQNCGIQQGWVANINELYNNTDEISNIEEALNDLIINFDLQKICILNSMDKKLLITDLVVNEDQETNQGLSIIYNISITCVPIVLNNFNAYLKDSPVNTDAQKNTVLENIGISILQPQIIIDFNNHILYSTYKEIYNVQS